MAQARVAEHQIVVGFEIFGIDRERGVEIRQMASWIVALKKEDAAKIVVDNAVARDIARCTLRRCAMASSYWPSLRSDVRVEEIGAREAGIETASARSQHFFGRRQISFLHANASDD